MKYKVNDYVKVQSRGIGKIVDLGIAWGGHYIVVRFNAYTEASYYVQDFRVSYIGGKNKRILFKV